MASRIVKADVNKESKWDKNLIIHYTHEARFTTLKRRDTSAKKQPLISHRFLTNSNMTSF